MEKSTRGSRIYHVDARKLLGKKTRGKDWRRGEREKKLQKTKSLFEQKSGGKHKKREREVGGEEWVEWELQLVGE